MPRGMSVGRSEEEEGEKLHIVDLVEGVVLRCSR